MASTRVQWRRGNTAQTAVFTGAVSEITVDTDRKVVVVHDGVTSGGFPASTLSFAQAAFDKANLASSNGTTSGDYANAAFIQANAAFLQANTPSHVANAAAIYANGAFAQSNSAFNHANSAYESQNVTGSYANSAYNWANTAYNAASNAYNFVTSVNVYSFAAFSHANASFEVANSSSNYANGAFAQANAAYNHANTRYSSSGGTISGDVTITGNTTPTTDNVYTLGTQSNRWKSIYVGPGSVYVGNSIISETAGVLSIAGVTDLRFPGSNLPSTIVISDTANSAGSYANSAFNQANAAFVAANNVAPQVQPSFNTANAAFAQANAAYSSQNTTGTYANSAFTAANSAGNYANSAFTAANSAGSYANSAYGQANTATTDAATADSKAVSAGNYANGAFAQANAAFNKANTSVQTSGVNSITSGSLTITNTGGVGLTVTGNAVFNNDITVAGNVFIGGNATSFGANNITVEDSMIFLANNNNQDLVDIGFVAHFNSGAGIQHTGLVRDASDDTWKFFSNVYPNPTTTVDFTNAVYDPVVMGALTASSATINSVNILPYTQAAFAQANAAYGSQNTTGTYANSAFTAANSAGNYANSAYTQANTATTNASTADSKAVTAGNYANSAFTQANTAVTNAAAASSYANSAFLKANNAVANTSGTTFNGDFLIGSGGKLTVLAAGGDEGGEMLLGKPPNGTLGGGVTIDAYQNRLRIFEQGGGARGVYIDLTEAAGGVATNLLNQSSITVNTNGNITSSTFTTGASTSQVTVDSFATTTYRSAKYEVQITAGSSYHVIELRVVHNGTTVWLSQYGEIFTGSSLGTFDASITSGTLNLQFTPASATVTTVRTIRTAIAV